MRLIAALIALGLSAFSHAQGPTPLITNPPIEVTSEDFEASLLRVPPVYRPEVRASMERIGKLVDQVYSNRMLAIEARRLGLDKDPLVRKRLEQVEEAYLAQLWTEHHRKGIKVPPLTARAEELYRANRARYVDPERLTGWYLFVSLQGRTRDGALEYARKLRERAVAGDDFATLIASFSEDPNIRANRGRLESVAASDLDKPVADAAFALKAKGDISEPIETRNGFHIVRFESKAPSTTRSFADVKEEIMEAEDFKFRDLATEKEIGRLKNTPTTVVHTKNIDALRKDLDQEQLSRLQRESAKQAAKPEGAR